MEELGKGWDRLERVLNSFQLDRTKSRLKAFGKDMCAMRDRLEGIEPPSLSRDMAETSVVGAPRVLDHDHGLSYDHYRGAEGTSAGDSGAANESPGRRCLQPPMTYR